MLYLKVRVIEVKEPKSYTNKKGITKDVSTVHVESNSFYFDVKGYSEDVLMAVKNSKNGDCMFPVRASVNKFTNRVDFWVTADNK